MNRRDFLTLRMTRHGQTLEVSGRRLYMSYLDAKASEIQAEEAPVEYDAQSGEAPIRLASRSVDELLDQLEEDLSGVERLRILEAEWLASTELGVRLAPLIASFEARGGRVFFVSNPA